ncbi:hypothetical protein H0178_56815 [Cytobacillus firmus]|nr:hypothetical protein [Cytobacillus firmus]
MIQAGLQLSARIPAPQGSDIGRHCGQADGGGREHWMIKGRIKLLRLIRPFIEGGFLCHGEAPLHRVEPASHHMLTVFLASR